jgi:hypothetical protein
MESMNTTFVVGEAKASRFYATVLAAAFQTMLDTGVEARAEIIFSFLPFHVDLGVGEDVLRNMLNSLADAEEGALGEFSRLVATSPVVMSALRKVTYGSV